AIYVKREWRRSRGCMSGSEKEPGMSAVLDRVYAASPIWVQQAMVAAFGWAWYRRRFGGEFSTLVDEFKSRDRWTAEQFREYQEQRLREILSAAWRSSYYAEV